MNDSEVRPRILVLTSFFAPVIGGAGAVAEALAAYLPQHIVIAAPRAQSDRQAVRDWPVFDRRFPFRCLRVPSFERKLPFTLPRPLRGPAQFAFNLLWTRPVAILSLLRQLGTTPIDVVCVNSLKECYWVPPLLKLVRPKLKVIFYLHGEEVNDSAHPPRIDRLAQKQMRQADEVVAVSNFTRERALRCGVAPDRVTVIHNGVDTARFFPGLPDNAIRARFHLDSKKVLLCLARLDERKGQDMLLDAMPAILQAVPSAVLLLVGGGSESERQRLQTRAAALGIGDAALFAGTATDAEVVAYYRTADLYIMPNRTTDGGDTEGFGLVFLEAGACGKPVIGGRAGGVPDAILDGKTGLLVDGRSSTEIAEACIALLTDDTLAARLGANGLEHSRNNSWERQSQRFLELSRTIAALP